jgi:hypothetical protein
MRGITKSVSKIIIDILLKLAIKELKKLIAESSFKKEIDSNPFKWQ